MNKCPFCKEDITYESIGNRDAYVISCRKCGDFKITRTAYYNLKSSSFSERNVANIYGWLYQNRSIEITTKHESYFKSLNTPSFHTKADSLLLHIETKTKYAGLYVDRDYDWLHASSSANVPELMEIISFLKTTFRIEQFEITGKEAYKILPDGWAHLETFKSVNQSETQGFVAMWFSEEMTSIYDDAISKGISDAGYKPLRVDFTEYNHKIDDEVIAQIRRSKFLLADFTGHSAGVYFEAGFAKGLGLEVIWTCSEDDVDNLHFDIRQYNCISWKRDNVYEFRMNIKNRIESIMGAGPYRH